MLRMPQKTGLELRMSVHIYIHSYTWSEGGIMGLVSQDVPEYLSQGAYVVCQLR